MNNPFKPNTTSHYDWEILKDLKWHCTKCELKSGQAKTWQVWRQNGIQLDTDEKGNFYKIQECTKCNSITVHRKLKSLQMLEETKVRSGISQYLARRVKEIYNNEEAVYLRQMPPKELEVDHKFPQVRWNSDEEENKPTMSEAEIRAKFILLTRSNNLLKSRYCEKCFKTNKRGSFPGINFWYDGDENWIGDQHDEKGCTGCFWYDPYEWRKKLNELVSSKNN